MIIGSVNSLPIDVQFSDSPALDSFQRLRVSQATTLFDAQQEYGLDTLRTWDASANGTIATESTNGSATSGSNAIGPTVQNTGMTPVTVSTTNGHYSILQSRQYTRYVPGFGQLIFQTGVFASGSGWTTALVHRTSTSGSVVDTAVAQSAWSIDKFDGTGPSGLILDLTKTQILFTQAQWLGVGRVVMGFGIGGRLYPAHQFRHANILTVPYTQTFNLPVRYELINTTASESKSRVGYFDSASGFFLETTRAVAGGSIQMICASVQTEGGTSLRGFPNSASNGVTSIGVTTRRPILSIRPKATYNSRTNRGHIEFETLELTAATNSAYYELVVGGTLTNASFAQVSAESIAERDVAATAITGGTTIISGFVTAGAGSVRGGSTDSVDFRNPMVISQIDAAAARQIPFTVVCTSFTGTSNLAASMDWHERII